MSPRTGRPKAENPKGINLTIRLDPKMNEKLQVYCEKNSITRGEAVRQGLRLLLEKK